MIEGAAWEVIQVVTQNINYRTGDPAFTVDRNGVITVWNRAAEKDIGMGDPMGMVVASAAAQAFDYVGLPEGIFPLVHATLYLSTAPKSNSTRPTRAARRSS